MAVIYQQNPPYVCERCYSLLIVLFFPPKSLSSDTDAQGRDKNNKNSCSGKIGIFKCFPFPSIGKFLPLPILQLEIWRLVMLPPMLLGDLVQNPISCGLAHARDVQYNYMAYSSLTWQLLYHIHCLDSHSAHCISIPLYQLSQYTDTHHIHTVQSDRNYLHTSITVCNIISLAELSFCSRGLLHQKCDL
jgi:hypothetical protein